mgnify:CR=1 FL=1
MRLVLHDEVGRITHTVEGAVECCRGLLDTWDLLVVVDELPDMNTFYVKDGEVIERPTIPQPDRTTLIADGYDTIVMNFPEELWVSIDEVMLEAPTSMLELVSDHADIYEIEIDQWPYFPFRTQVVAT